MYARDVAVVHRVVNIEDGSKIAYSRWARDAIRVKTIVNNFKFTGGIV